MRSLVGSRRIESTRQVQRLVGDHTDRTSVDTRVPGDDVRGGLRADFEEIAVVEDLEQDVVHVVAGVVGVGHERIEFDVVGRDLGLETRVDHGSLLLRIRRHVAQVLAHPVERRLLVGRDMVHIAVFGLLTGASELFEADVLTRDRLDDVGAGDEHVRLFGRHDDVGVDRCVHGTAGALADDDRDLWDQPGQRFGALADLAVPGERGHCVLDAGPTGVVDTHDRATDLQCVFQNGRHLAAEHLTDAATQNGLVVREHRDGPAVDQAVPDDDRVAVERVRVPWSPHQCTDLDEGALSRSMSMRSRALGMPF